MNRNNTKKLRIRSVLILQAVIAVYSCSTVVAKFAAGQELFRLPFLLLYGLEIGILGLYAILWQQVIKRMDLSTAYANRSVGILWSLLYAVIFFQETITLNNVIGVIIVMIGTIIVNSDE